MSLSLVAVILSAVTLLAVVWQAFSLGKLHLELAVAKKAMDSKSNQDLCASDKIADEFLQRIDSHFLRLEDLLLELKRQSVVKPGAAENDPIPNEISLNESEQVVATYQKSESLSQTSAQLARYERSDSGPLRSAIIEPQPSETLKSIDTPVIEQKGFSTEHAGDLLVHQYRQLLAEPRKSEINRWMDEHGGLRCEITEDGVIALIGREGGGMLALLPLENDLGLLLPSARLVVDFATSFASTLTMRPITRDSFELISDGTGVLRLIEPAIAKLSNDRWALVSPGSLAGLTSA